MKLVNEIRQTLNAWGKAKDKQASEKKLKPIEMKLKDLSSEVNGILDNYTFENFEEAYDKMCPSVARQIEQVFNEQFPFICGFELRVHLQPTTEQGSSEGCYIFLSPYRSSQECFFFGYTDDHLTLNLTVQALIRRDFSL